MLRKYTFHLSFITDQFHIILFNVRDRKNMAPAGIPLKAKKRPRRVEDHIAPELIPGYQRSIISGLTVPKPLRRARQNSSEN